MIRRNKTAEKAFHLSQSRYVFATFLGRMSGKAIRHSDKKGIQSPLLKSLDRRVKSRLSRLEGLSPEERDRINETMSRTSYWHGTGRYQYRNGAVVDILAQIIKSGTLQPHLDPFDLNGSMESISLAKSRMYARSYADIHRQQNADFLRERHGSSIFWAAVFLGDYFAESAREENGLRKTMQRLNNAGKESWHKKINKTPLSVFGCFARGSDIEGNYPIVFGVRTVNSAYVSRAIALHEVRTRDPLGVSDSVTYIEVPRDKIAETKKLLYEHDTLLPVFAIEDFERHAVDCSFSQLMVGTSQR